MKPRDLSRGAVTSGVVVVDSIEKYLFAEYQKRGNVDFFVHSNKLVKHVGKSSHAIGYGMRILADTGSVIRYKKQLYKTIFSHKNELKPEPIKKSWWKRIFRNQ